MGSSKKATVSNKQGEELGLGDTKNSMQYGKLLKTKRVGGIVKSELTNTLGEKCDLMMGSPRFFKKHVISLEEDIDDFSIEEFVSNDVSFLIQIDNKTIGCASAIYPHKKQGKEYYKVTMEPHMYDADGMYVTDVSVVVGYRNRGIATSLLNAIMDHAESNGKSMVEFVGFSMNGEMRIPRALLRLQILYPSVQIFVHDHDIEVDKAGGKLVTIQEYINNHPITMQHTK